MTRPLDEPGRHAAADRNPEDRRAAAAVIGAHTLQHLYQQGFFVILPEIYRSLGMTPVAAGALEMVRRGAGGVASMGGGFALDRFPEKRVPLLYLSLLAMGLGYVAVSVAPTYIVILMAIGLAGTAGSVWHPAALGLLSQVFPQRRGLVISMHRSSGSVGDALGPLLVGGLLVLVSWQTVLVGALPLAAVFAVLLWLALLQAPSWKARAQGSGQVRSTLDQFRDLGAVVRSRSLLMLLVIAAFSGLGQGGVVMWLSLYLSEAQGMGSVGIGIHVALLTGFGIVAGPLIGAWSDRVGRRPVIAGVMACKALFAAAMAVTGSGLWFTASVALLGAVMFGVNSLIQASALDIAHGRRLEGSMIGVLWGFNALFTGVSPLLVGFLVAGVGYGVVFWYVAAVNLCGTVAAVLMLGSRQPA
jgi:MFS transporter, FSR family, fosmidomycin resistance protein